MKTVRITITLSKDTYTKMEKVRKKLKMTRSAFVRKAIEDYFKEKEKE